VTVRQATLYCAASQSFPRCISGCRALRVLVTLPFAYKTANKRRHAAISPKLFFKLKVMACSKLPRIRIGQVADHLSVFNSR